MKSLRDALARTCRAVRHDRRSRDDAHGQLRRDRGDDRDAARARRSRRRGHRVEPFYENYGPDADIAGAQPVYVPLRPPENVFDPDELRRAFPADEGDHREHAEQPDRPRVHARRAHVIASLCIEHDVVAVTDEIYEHILYEGEHIPMATLPGMAERTVTICGTSKTFTVTGWRRLDVAPPELATGSARCTTS